MSGRFAWPTDSRPVVEVYGGVRAALREYYMRIEHMRRPWDQAETREELCELVAQFCEGKLGASPNHWAKRDPETREIGPELAHANRNGFLTVGSQPAGACTVTGWDGLATVEGFADQNTVDKLARLVRGTRLVMRVFEPRGRFERRRADWHVSAAKADDMFGWEFSDELQVTIYDPDVNGGRLLWDRLAQPDWDNPSPPPEETAVPDHTATAVTCAAPDCSRSFPTAAEMHQHLADDHQANVYHCDDPDCDCEKPPRWWTRLFRRAAGQDPDPPRVAAPPRHPTPEADNPTPPAEAPMNQAAAGAVQGVSQVTPTGLATTAASAATGKDIKTPTAAAAGGATTGGAGMSNIEEAKAGIANATEQVQEAQGAAQQVAEQVEEALQSLRQAASGSDQGEYESAEAALQHIKEVAEELVKLLGAAPAELESIRL